MVIVELFMGIDVCHEIKGSVGAQDARARVDGDAVGLADGHESIDLDVGIDQEKVAHFAGLDVMRAKDAGGSKKGLANALDLVLVGGAVHEVVQGVPRKSPSGPSDDGSDDDGGDGVEKGVAHKASQKAQKNDEGGGRVRAGVPSVGGHEGGLSAESRGAQVAKKGLFANEGERGDAKGKRARGGDRLGVGQL